MSTLLTTKLGVPLPGLGLVARPRLDQRLDLALGAHTRLILVSAPAGYGKTTLFSAWVHRLDASAATVAWLSLDADDNAPTRFLRHLVAAVAAALPPAHPATALAQGEGALTPDTVAAALINALNGPGPRLFLALDDAHVIVEPTLHAFMTTLLRHAPPTLCLALLTRADPPLTLARLRAQGRLVEIRADDLRFTTVEAGDLLARLACREVAPAEVDELTRRSEGWVTGLQLMAHALHDHPDLSGLIDAHGTGQQSILDFLTEEVLAHQPEDLRSFLYATCVLSELCGPLCDALTGRSDGQAMLGALQRASLFIVALDREQRWFRYHRLFADLLRTRLLQSDPAQVRALHARAARWLVSAGRSGAAIRHAIAAEDPALAAHLVEQAWMPTLSIGEVDTVRRWIAALPAPTIEASDPLTLAACWTHWLKGDFTILARQVSAWERRTDGAAELMVRAEMGHFACYLARQRGDLKAAAAHAHHALALAPYDARQLRALLLAAIGHLAREQSDTTGALHAYEAALPLLTADANPSALTSITFYLCQTYLTRGRLHAAAELAAATFRTLRSAGLAHAPALGLVHVALATVLHEQGELESATHHALIGIELGERGGATDTIRHGGLALARIRTSAHDLPGARLALDRAAQALDGSGLAWAGSELAAARARLALDSGRLRDAVAWADATRARAGTAGFAERDGMLYARILVRQGRGDAAVALLRSYAVAAANDGRDRSLAEAELLLALAEAGHKHQGAAVASLAHALELAGPEGYRCLFTDTGPPLQPLLAGVVAREPAHSPRATIARQLLAASPPAHVAAAPTHGTQPEAPEATLAETLSGREHEVLGLLAEGLTTQAIAERLIIAPGTAKIHIHHILGKLGARNRIQALQRARAAGLLHK